MLRGRSESSPDTAPGQPTLTATSPIWDRSIMVRGPDLRGRSILGQLGELIQQPLRYWRWRNSLERERRLPPIKMRAGINTGSVVVGTLGNDLRVKFTAVGDTVNLASRMETLADPGTTYVTEETFQTSRGKLGAVRR
jgi:hypothetical protein